MTSPADCAGAPDRLHHPPAATDLGYLLHKHPDRVQEFRQSFGTVTVFYPEATEERCTVALMLEVDPVRLARSRGRNAPDFSLAQYVNDRSYAASSLLGVAMADVFSTARSGRCDVAPGARRLRHPAGDRDPGAAVPRRSAGRAPDLRAAGLGRGGRADPARRRVPRLGRLALRRLRLTGTVRLADALNQLYVLLPVLDESKHYWVGPDEVDKLLRSGEGWLATHPEGDLITRRYLGRSAALTRAALARLAELGDEVEEAVEPAEDEEVLQPEAERVPLNVQRHEAVLDVLLELGARSGDRPRLRPGAAPRPARRRRPPSPASSGADVSTRSLQLAARRLHARPDERAPGRQRRALPVRAHLRGRALRRLRRRRADGGHRARRPAAARGAGAGRVRRRPPRCGRS